MLERRLFHGFCRGGAVLGVFACLALLSACSSDDKRPLVQVNVALGTYGVPVETVAIAAMAGDIQLPPMSVPPNPSGRYGLYLPAGTSGTVTVHVSVLGRGGCTLATGSVAGVKVTPGEITKPIDVQLTSSDDLCLGDGGVPDSAAPPEDVGVPLDTFSMDADSTGDLVMLPVDVGPDAGADTRVPDTGAPDVAPADAAGDQAPVLEAGTDSSADLPIAPDAPAIDVSSEAGAGPDGGAVVPTTMNVLQSCRTYNHSDDTGTDWGIRQLVFSPDGQYLVSVGDDARLKVWRVSATGLAPVGDLVFAGGRQNPVAAFSSDGKMLAVGHGYDNVITVYDFAQSVATGMVVKKWNIPAAVATANSVAMVQFTSDLGHLVALYDGDLMEPTNYLVVWELATTPTNMKQVTYPEGERPYAVVVGPYPGSMHVASAAPASVDGGQASTIAVTDITTASRLQATLPGEVDRMAFTPDGKNLVVGVNDTGEVTRWSVGTSLVRAALPLVPGTARAGATNFDFAVTVDGKYLGVAVDDGANSIKVVALSQTEAAVAKVAKYYPWSLAFAPSGLALAIGQASEAMVLYCTP